MWWMVTLTFILYLSNNGKEIVRSVYFIYIYIYNGIIFPSLNPAENFHYNSR